MSRFYLFGVLTALPGLLGLQSDISAQIPAFPGAEGFGAYATGGRGGDVYYVDNLDNDGPGSFADAVATVPEDGRTIVFSVSGYVHVNKTALSRSRVTIAGQTAPGDGIGFKDGSFIINGDDIIIRHVRFRYRDQAAGGDCINFDDGITNVILDHLSLAFSTDENIASFEQDPRPDLLTFQWSLNSWGLEDHSAGGLWDIERVTTHHTLWAHHHTRNPKARPYGLLDWINNVTFDWGIGFIMGDSETPASWKANVIGNYFVCPPGNLRSVALEKARIDRHGNHNFTLHVAANLFDKNGDSVLNGSDYGYDIASGSYRLSASPLVVAGPQVPVTPDPPLTAYKKIVSRAGPLRLDATASIPLRDEVDTILIDNLVTLTRHHISHEDQTGASNNGMGFLNSVPPSEDSDRDGMPDCWELTLGWNPTVQDHNTLLPSAGGLMAGLTFFPPDTPAGYTRLEEYLHFLAIPHAIIPRNMPGVPSSLTTDLRRFTSGFDREPVIFTISNVTNGTATLGADGHTLAFTPTPRFSGRARLDFTVTDGDGSTWTQTLAVLVNAVDPPLSVVFQQGEDGYAGTVDTMLLEASPSTNRGTAPELSVDGDDPGGSGQETHVLIRFEDIVGEGPGQIPPGSSIRSARLELSSSDAGDGAAAHRMRAAWTDADSWATFGGDGIQAGIETFPEPDGFADALGGGVVSLDVTSGVALWAASGCPNFGWALLPVGDDGWDFFSSEGDKPPRLVVKPRPFVGDPLIVAGDEWRYFKGTQEPPVAWNQRGFLPGAGWLSGFAGIGYGDGDDATILDDMQGNYPSVFCRREFEVGPFVKALRLRIDYDDGFVAYINGVEVARSTSLAAPGAPLAWDMLARSAREAGGPEVFDLATSAIVPGVNVLAIQVHNVALDSSDCSLIPELSADYALVAPGADWRFLRGSEPLPPDWIDPEFDDASWEEGPTGIGYGGGDDVTGLLDMQGSYGAVFCRKEFHIDTLDAVGAIAVRVLYDDGIVVFANGTEVERINVPVGPVSANLLALSAVEPVHATVRIPVDLVVEGRNVIAVSVHNVAIDSSDLSFDPVVYEIGRASGSGCGPLFRRGDSNTDSTLNIADAVFTLMYLFASGPAPACEDAADANDDGPVDLADSVYILQNLFANGPAIPPPYPGCGIDPTIDDLDCAEYQPCQP